MSNYTPSVPMSCLVAGYVKKYNLIPIKKGTTAFNCNLDKPSWNNPAIKQYPNHTFSKWHRQYSYADICDWIDEMEDFEIIELEATYND